MQKVVEKSPSLQHLEKQHSSPSSTTSTDVNNVASNEPIEISSVSHDENHEPSTSFIENLPDCQSVLRNKSPKMKMSFSDSSVFKKPEDVRQRDMEVHNDNTVRIPSLTESNGTQKETSPSDLPPFKKSEDITPREIDLHNMSTLEIPSITEIPLADLKFTGEILGSGSFGTVSTARWSGTLVAVKTMETMSVTAKDIAKEVAILKQVSHDNIVAIMGVAAGKIEFHIVMQLVTGNI